MITKLIAACYIVLLMFHITNIITLKAIYFAYFHFIMRYGIIWLEGGVGVLPAVGGYLLHEIKSSELWLVHILEPLVDVFL